MNDIHARFQVQYPGFALTVDLTLPGRGVTALFGPSGSGKTTLLRCIAGLERAPGRLMVGDACWQDDDRRWFMPVHQRPLGYVFQEANLFPHLSVSANLHFGMQRIASAERRISFDDAVAWLDVEPLLPRKPDRLSGGERQRVAIARALLTSPQLLLMDEPLAALDRQRKAEILPYLERLHSVLDLPIIYVSHAPDEVARLADHLVLMQDGEVKASGALQPLLLTDAAATALGDDAGVVWQGTVDGHDDRYGLTHLGVAAGQLWVTRRPESRGERLRLQIKARDVSLSLTRATDTSINNVLPATITRIHDAPHPSQVMVHLNEGDAALLALVSRRSAEQLQLKPGLALWAQVKAVALLA